MTNIDIDIMKKLKLIKIEKYKDMLAKRKNN